jgi:hypothetical protein
MGRQAMQAGVATSPAGEERSACADDAVRSLLRPAATVMRLARMGSFHSTRLSFGRSLVRRMSREGWRFREALRQLDDDGFGRLVHEIETPRGLVSFAAFSSDLAPAERTDRVIAEKWDAAFVLAPGRLAPADLERLAEAAPRQEAARYSADELVLSRANKSLRLFDAVIASLAAERQPDLAEIVRVGYLMRTTAVYGNGKSGLADLGRVWRDGIFSLPYEAEMLMVYLIRQFSFDLIEHIAKRRNPTGAARLSPTTRRALGIGNATGLGMAPFLVGHPMLLNNWILARETALARVRSIAEAMPDRVARFGRLLERAIGHCGQWFTDEARQVARIATLRAELAALRRCLAGDPALLAPPRPWNRLARLAEETQSLETSELINSLLIELYPEHVDTLERITGSPEAERIEPGMSLAELAALIEQGYGWALPVDYRDPLARHLVPLGREGRAAAGRALQRAGRGQGAAARHRPDGGRPPRRAGAPARRGGTAERRRLPARAPAMARHRPPRPGPGRPALCRDPRQPARPRLPAHRPAALQALDLRRRQVRPQIRPLDAPHPVPGRARHRGARRGRRRRLGLPLLRCLMSVRRSMITPLPNPPPQGGRGYQESAAAAPISSPAPLTGAGWGGGEGLYTRDRR